MEEKREVHFDDCEVGMFFRIDKDCPWMYDNQWMDDNFDIWRNADKLQVKITDIDDSDDAVEVELWAGGRKTHITDWLYQYTDDPEDRIGDNLEFLRPNRKNNYW